jgi:hypothetical protein
MKRIVPAKKSYRHAFTGEIYLSSSARNIVIGPFTPPEIATVTTTQQHSIDIKATNFQQVDWLLVQMHY